MVPDRELASSTIDTVEELGEQKAHVPMVLVKLIHSVRALLSHSVLVDVKVEEVSPNTESLLLQCNENLELLTGVSFGDVLIQPSQDGNSCILITNTSTFTSRLEQGQSL